MYFKVTKEQLKKSIVLLKNRIEALKKGTNEEQKIIKSSLEKMLEEINFAVYKTKLKEFYIDYDTAIQIRSALNSEDKK